MTGGAIEVVHVGSACRDVAPEDPRGWRIGGGVMYAALSTARLGLPTAAVVGVDAAAAEATEFELLRDAGVELLMVPLSEGPIYHNLETPRGRVQTCVQVGVPLPIPDLPARLVRRAGLVGRPGRRRGPRRLGRGHPGQRPRRGRLAGVPARSPRRGARPPAAATSVAHPAPRRSHRREPPRRRARRSAGGALGHCSVPGRTCWSRRVMRAAC